MKGIRYSLLLAVCLILVTACMPNFPIRVPSGETITEPTEVLSVETKLPPMVEGLALQKIENAEFLLANGSTNVQLIDGEYESINDNETLRVSLLEQIVFRDLDGDGSEDAVVLLVENYGGTGQFEYLVPALNFKGEAFPQKGYFLGDRVAVNPDRNYRICHEAGMLVHGPGDGLCCPSMPVVRSFEYYPGLGFKLVHVASGIEGQNYRDITLDAPVQGDSISTQFQISGSFTISPFEATLVVRAVDMQDQVLLKVPIMASVVNLGDPGTFSEMIDMTSVNIPSGLVRVEVFEVSMADGSILVLDSVLVLLQ